VKSIVITGVSSGIGKATAREYSPFGASTAESIAAGIYVAATDDKKQLRYLLGDDAVQTYTMREQIGDDAFMTGIRKRILS
jgi:NAD(P)-dependent dehydrogenase (short-subunit alcohol dehydrogenase family)